MANRYKPWVVRSNYKISWSHFNCQNSDHGIDYFFLEIFSH